MLKKLLIVLGIFMASQACLLAQGTLKGVVKDETGEPLPMVNIKVMQQGEFAGGTTTDFDGMYTVKPLAPGLYDVVISLVGYPTKTVQVQVAASGFSTAPEVTMTEGVELDLVVDVVEYKVKLIDQTSAESGVRLTGEDIARMPSNTVDGIAAMTAGISYSDGGAGTARGESGMVTYVGGVRKQGNVNIPKESIAELQYILGGTPARYGEARGGVQVITLNPPARKFLGSVKYETTELFDTRGYNRLDLYLTGPIWKKEFTDAATNSKYERTIIGYRLSAYDRLQRDVVYRPRNQALYALTDEQRQSLEQTPLRVDPLNPRSVTSNADYLHEDAFTQVVRKSNMWNNFFYVEGGLDISFTQNMTLALNAEYTLSKGMNGSASNFVANNDNNPTTTAQSFQISGEFTHRFPDAPNSTSIFKKVMYSLTGSYSLTKSTTMSATHKDNFFDYGYIGRFQTQMYPSYTLQRYTLPDGTETDAWVQTSNGTSGVLFDNYHGNPNPLLANYTSQLYNDERIRPYLEGDIRTTDAPDLELIRIYKGLVNGEMPTGGYGLFALPGFVESSYAKGENEALFLQGKASADVGNHALEIGVQYDRQTNRSYRLSPVGLWKLMRDLTNKQFAKLSDTPIDIDYSGAVPVVTLGYDYNGSAQSQFDRALRQKLGYDVAGTNWINIDELAPSTFSLDMFTADELLNQGSPYITYSGYDHTGKKISGKHSLADFYYNKNSRTLDAWSPEYFAAYIQDQFYISDLIFNVGVRLDRFDGNQMVLKDPYLLYDSYTVGDMKGGNHPSAAQNDWVVYVDQYTTPDKAQIRGYRSGNVWYDATGQQIADPQQISGNSGQPTPFRKSAANPEAPSLDMFEDYQAQYVVMPRIAFSFPVSDESQFKASYDIIANRPSSRWQADYVAYLYPLNSQYATINNPNLKPERITNYEIGFQQVLSKSSAISLNAYYKETSDLIQMVQYTGADPNPNVFSYDNFDFKTTKGFTLQYDLRQTRNFRMVANYTLQFAEGTALPPATMQSLIKEGYPSLKILNPITDDIRNAFKVNFDYRFGLGKNYNGPTTTKKVVKDGVETEKTTRWLQGFGANLQLVAQSGRPYTRRLSNTQPNIVGSYNGARLPWQFFIDLVIDKSWIIKVGKENKKDTRLTAALTFTNLLNIRNIKGVFPVTGDPDDDGYLTDPDTQAIINAYTDPEAFRVMYEYLQMQNQAVYANYSQPRFIKLGLTYTF